MNKDKKHFIKTKHLLVILIFICISTAALTLTDKVDITPVRNVAGFFVVPFQNGINKVGKWLNDATRYFQNAEELSRHNDELKKQIDSLTEENSLLTQDTKRLSELEQLYNLDKEYAEYDKVAAEVIAKEPGNYFHEFTINRGSDSGIAVDMNVITGGGLVGLVTKVGSNWATVRSIIDDNNSVSAMTISTGGTCIVSGGLENMKDQKLYFDQMSSTNTVSEGEKIVTSTISDKYLKGILIGYVSEVKEDPNHLTNTGYLVPVVDFEHITDVLVIKQLKETGGE